LITWASEFKNWRRAMSDNKGSVVRTLVIIIVIIIVDVVGGYFIGTKVIIPMLYKNEDVAGNPDAKAENDKDKKNKKGEKSAVAVVLQKNLEPINLNPAKSGGEIFSCQIVLVSEDQAVIDEITAKEIDIRDKISTYLSFKTVPELNEPANWEAYRKEMIDIVNKCLTAGKISSLLIPQKIIQFY
jgi:flagellar basal body-associated protein FliL